MKKIFSLLTISLFLVIGLQAQTTVFADDFEAFTVGDKVAQNDTSGFWDTWSHTPGSAEDAVISGLQNHTAGGSKSMLVSGINDMVMYLLNKTTGIYTINFWYFVPTNFGAYFNLQHTQNMGQEWAFQAMMDKNGTGVLTCAGTNIDFNYPKDEWFEVLLNIDLNADEIILTIDSNVVNTWQFSLQANGTAGTKQIGAFNFYAGAPTGQTPKYFLDDVLFIENEAAIPPAEVGIDIESITYAGSSAPLIINNLGQEDLLFDVFAFYPQEATKQNVTTNSNNVVRTVKLTPSSMQSQANSIIVDLPKDAELTHLTGNILRGYGWNSNVNVDAQVVTLFKSDFMEQYVGMTLTNVIVFTSDAPIAGSTNVQIWSGRRGAIPGPVTLLTEESFVGVQNGQTSVDLTTPVYVTGEDFWLGYNLTQGPGLYCVSIDAGPPADDANWSKTGLVWGEITEPDFGNIGVVGTLTGTSVHRWISLQSNQGIIEGESNATVVVDFDLTGMLPGVYEAALGIRTNDLSDDEDYLEIPVYLTVVSLNEMAQTAVMTFPNPAYDFLNVRSNENISKIEVISSNGQVVATQNTDAKDASINISNLEKGIYFVNVTTESGISSSKIIIK